MNDNEYYALLDRAFSLMPASETQATADFVIPKADSFIQGNKTIIRNFAQIADIARRKPELIQRFLIKELGTPSSIDGQTLKINARFQPEVLNDKIKKYFETYVICRECHKPDTHIESSERGYEVIVCEACGARYTVKEL
ncbi:MAG: translation initiation factor IF-2 subunit beta [Candidatus Micrarchaeia archaeon]|jgi:translation initiation factor 2 subunit 2